MLPTTLTTVIGTLDKLFKVFKDNEDELQIGKLLDRESRKVVLANGNMFRVIDDLMVEPKVLVSQDLKHHEHIQDIVSFNTALFASVYSDVFTMLIGLHHLDAATAVSLLSSGMPGEYGVETDTSIMKDVETKWGKLDLEFGLEKSKSADRHSSGDKSSHEQKLIDGMFRKLSFKITTGKGDKAKTVTIQVMIRPIVGFVPNSDFFKMVKVNGDDTTLSAAYHALRSGERTATDVVLGSTLVDDYKRGRLNDVDSTLGDLESRKRLARAKVLKDGAVGFGLLYQLCIIPSGIKGDINTLLRGKLDKDRIKDKFLEVTKSLTLTIVDDDWEMISLYINGMKGSHDIPFAKLKDKNNKNSEISDLFKLMTTSRGI